MIRKEISGWIFRRRACDLCPITIVHPASVCQLLSPGSLKRLNRDVLLVQGVALRLKQVTYLGVLQAKVGEAAGAAGTEEPLVEGKDTARIHVCKWLDEK